MSSVRGSATLLDRRPATPRRPRPRPRRPRRAEPPLDLRDVRVLVVEDDEDGREMMRQIVESFGATVDGACDGAQALQMAWENRPDLIFADLAMPILDGYAFLARVRADPGLSRVPVIAVSAHGSEDDIMRTWREGFSGHLVKPVDYGVIAAQLRRAFWAHDRRSPLPASL